MLSAPFQISAIRAAPCRPAAQNFLIFSEFDHRLRSALTRKDAVAMAFLVKFPLRVNQDGGTISIDDAPALKTHFEDVFTPTVRNKVLASSDKAAQCSVEGIGYPDGVIWVQASERGYAIWSVNRNSVPPNGIVSTPKTDYVCQTQTHRIVVDEVAGGTLRYRSWKKPRWVTEVPDLELEQGKQSFEGTDVCAVPIFTFTHGSVVYSIDGSLGCFDSSHPPPVNATGHLLVTEAGKAVTDAWCY